MESAGPARMRIKKHGEMLTDAILVADEGHLDGHSDDRSPAQLVNTASMHGIVGEAWAMADWHFGYGFPIGGVVATDTDFGELGGALSPGGVGFDINCGVRLCSLGIPAKDVDCKSLADNLATQIPSGATRKGGIALNENSLDSILAEGVVAAVELGLGESRDIGSVESRGILEAEQRNISDRARKRGSTSLGTLGSGNHFLELQVVDRVVDSKAAAAFGLFEGDLAAMIHTGSRGLGHQVCSEHVSIIESKFERGFNGWECKEWGFRTNDRQLASAPIHSREGENYFDAMSSAGNFAFANRSALTQKLREVLRASIGSDADLEVIYDVCHNIAKIEEHVVHGKTCRCCVHRKGATRALGGDHGELAPKFAGVGQPVLVPGDMGSASWVLAGAKRGGNDAFSSSCHGAGRRLSRSAARKEVDPRELIRNLEAEGIFVRAKTPGMISEEAPQAYKDVDEVVGLTREAGLARPVARLRPIAVIKG